jgi:hypothetical protein
MKLLENQHRQKPLTDDRFDQFAMHIRQPPIDPVMAERQPFVVDPQQVKDRRVQVVAIRGGSGFPGPFIAFAKGCAGADAAAGEPRAGCERVALRQWPAAGSAVEREFPAIRERGGLGETALFAPR